MEQLRFENFHLPAAFFSSSFKSVSNISPLKLHKCARIDDTDNERRVFYSLASNSRCENDSRCVKYDNTYIVSASRKLMSLVDGHF